jgi:hypothetical protein
LPNLLHEKIGADTSLIRRHGIPVLVCFLATSAVVLVPALIWWTKLGKFIYIQGYDNLFYLILAAQSYYNHLFYLSDPIVQGAPVVYPWLLFIPFVIVAHGLNLGAFGVNLVWMVFAAAGMALGSYFAFLPCVKRRWFAASCTIVFLLDSGSREGAPLLDSIRAFVRSLTIGARDFFASPKYDLLSPWRIVDPAIGMPFFLLNLGLVIRAVSKPSRTSILLAGASTGLLFYVYFFFWTPVMFGLIIALLLDRASYRVYAGSFLIGGILGMPSLISGFSNRKAIPLEGLQRMDLFFPIPHLFYLNSSYGLRLFPRVCASMCVLVGLWIWNRRRTDLIYPWSIGVAGLLLIYNSLITGEQLAPYHWGYAYGPAISFVVLAAAATELETFIRAPKARLIFAALFCAELVLTLYLRLSYAYYSGYANQVLVDYGKYIAQQEGPSHVSLVSNSVIAGDPAFSTLSVVGDNQHPLASASWTSVYLNDDEVEKRAAVNARLEGIGRAEFLSQAHALLSYYPPDLFDPAKGPALINGMLNHYESAALDLNRLADEYAVRYVAIPSTRTDPAYLDHGWKMIVSGPYWRIWERKPL